MVSRRPQAACRCAPMARWSQPKARCAPISPACPTRRIHTLAAFSDQSVLPPKEIGRYPVFVPKADDDGMAISGIRQLALAVPRATYTAWNPRAQGFGPTALYPLQGAVVPFAPTEAARKEVHDPRPSIAERYADNDAYVAAVRREAARQVAERLLLPEDAERAVEAAKQGKLAKLGPVIVGWVERSETRHRSAYAVIAPMGFAALYPSYAWPQPQDACPEVDPPAPSVGL